MRRVVFVTHSWGKPSEVFIQRHIDMLADAGCLVLIVLTHDSFQGEYRGIPVTSLKLLRTLPARIRRRLQRILGKETGIAAQFEDMVQRANADTILVNYGTSAIVIGDALRRSDKRVFIHILGYDAQADLKQHNLQPMHAPDYLPRLAEIMLNATILTNSSEGERRVREWLTSPVPIIVKPSGVEVPAEALSHSNNHIVKILHLGRLVDCKAPDRTLHAFELACERGLEGELIIAGDGPLRVMCELLRVRSPWKDRIHLLGAVDRVQAQALYHDADIFTQHSIVGELTGQIELLGISLIEAMAHALPVVSCPVGGIPESIIDGETGILTAPGDDLAQAEAFLRLARDPALRQQMGLAAWQRARKYYTIEAERKALLSIIDAL